MTYLDSDSADAANETSGSCGSNLNWTYDSASGLLTISGNGSMENYQRNSSRWGDNDVKTVIINSGVTSIGDYAFYGCTSLISVTIPGSVTTIEKYAFYGCAGLVSVIVDSNNITIESGKTANVFHVDDKYSTGVTVIWISSDEFVATVDYAGKITAVGSRTAVIKAVCSERVYAECNVAVSDSVVVSKYKIIFKNGDNILQETEFEFGVIPVYSGSIPEKAFTAQYTYTFKGWNPEIVAVSGEATYVAEFNEIVNEYTIKFISEGKEISSIVLKYGDRITAPAVVSKESDVQYSYEFKGWSGYTEGMTVTGNATFTAEFNNVSNEDSAENESNDYKFIIIGVVAAIAVLSVAVLIFRRL